MDGITHEVRLDSWRAIVAQCQARPKGQTIKQWLTDSDISENQYYYWQRRVRKEVYAECSHQLPLPVNEVAAPPAVAEIPIEELFEQRAAQATVTIKTRKSTIEISSEMTTEAMIELVKAVSHAL